ncbi:hypothetical protein ACTMTJ_40730 [Phytohabitans sp. LJ34]|uniref:hypothetical protein n=1 Tax=Phytohabitans sp. LJ34 TaxID=3452217 RepID=UPI003F89D3C9
MSRYLAWAVWPVGLLLTVAYAVAELVPLPVFLILDLAYLAAVAVVVRHAGTLAGLLVAPAGLIFSLAALTGAPTAREPVAMVANAGALAAAGTVLLVGAVFVCVRVWEGPGRGPAALAVTAVVVGTTCYLVNLLARAAVVLSGFAPAQAAVEDRAWQAHVYLRGLDGEPDLLTLLLVWLDLMQVAYVVLAYLGAALLAVAAHRAGWLATRPTRGVVALSAGMAAVASVAAVLGATPGPFGAAAAGAAFALTIPFMSTLPPALLGAALGRHRPTLS